MSYFSKTLFAVAALIVGSGVTTSVLADTEHNQLVLKGLAIRGF